MALKLLQKLTTGVALHRHSWLRATTLLSDSKAAIEDLPFDGLGLFHASTEATLQDIDKNIKTSRTLGVSQHQRQYKPRHSYSKQWPRRSCPSKSSKKTWKQHQPASTKPLFPHCPKYQPQGQPKAKSTCQTKQSLLLPTVLDMSFSLSTSLGVDHHKLLGSGNHSRRLSPGLSIPSPLQPPCPYMTHAPSDRGGPDPPRQRGYRTCAIGRTGSRLLLQVLPGSKERWRSLPNYGSQGPQRVFED